jgi:hypothetical protein
MTGCSGLDRVGTRAYGRGQGWCNLKQINFGSYVRTVEIYYDLLCGESV